MDERQEILSKREAALAGAKTWWKGKDPDGVYVCDACGGPINWNEEGSSLVGSWMRCKNCTDKILPAEVVMVHIHCKTKSGEPIHYPLHELIRGEYWLKMYQNKKGKAKKELREAIADRLHDPKIKNFWVKRLPNGDFKVY